MFIAYFHWDQYQKEPLNWSLNLTDHSIKDALFSLFLDYFFKIAIFLHPPNMCFKILTKEWNAVICFKLQLWEQGFQLAYFF